jgi:hypothetical protein
VKGYAENRTVKLFFDGSPDDVTAQYKEWLAQHPGIKIMEKPTITQEREGWKLTLWYQPRR